jgi:dihydrofolate synthase/folylpolyglutamate synthase
MLASILTASGEKVGLFTSPHILDFKERIRINGKTISEQEVINFCAKIQAQPLDFSPSFFEITFAMALYYFKKEECSICVIETGLGGRLDATNIILPLVSVITNISLEHTQFLGNTLGQIAKEKAGIIKESVPVVLGESTTETLPVFEQIAHLNNSELYLCDSEGPALPYLLPLLGNFQQTNLRTVLRTLEVLKSKGFSISETDIESGLKNLPTNTGFYGRMQCIQESPLTILDVSHNYDGVQKTLQSVQELTKGKLHILYGTSSDKNYEEIISLFPENSKINLCTFSSFRSLTLQQMQQLAEKMVPKPAIYTDVEHALSILQSAANKEDTILVFGSFFLISDFFEKKSKKHL